METNIHFIIQMWLNFFYFWFGILMFDLFPYTFFWMPKFVGEENSKIQTMSKI